MPLFKGRPRHRLYDHFRTAETPSGRPIPRAYIEGLGAYRKAAPQIWDPYPDIVDARGRQMPRYGLRGDIDKLIAQTGYMRKAAQERARRIRASSRFVPQTTSMPHTRFFGLGQDVVSMAMIGVSNFIPETVVHMENEVLKKLGSGQITRDTAVHRLGLLTDSIAKGLVDVAAKEWFEGKTGASAIAAVQDRIVGDGSTEQAVRGALTLLIQSKFTERRNALLDTYQVQAGQITQAQADANAERVGQKIAYVQSGAGEVLRDIFDPLKQFGSALPGELGAGVHGLLQWIAENWQWFAAGAVALVAAPAVLPALGGAVKGTRKALA